MIVQDQEQYSMRVLTVVKISAILAVIFRLLYLRVLLIILSVCMHGVLLNCELYERVVHTAIL